MSQLDILPSVLDEKRSLSRLAFLKSLERAFRYRVGLIQKSDEISEELLFDTLLLHFGEAIAEEDQMEWKIRAGQFCYGDEILVLSDNEPSTLAQSLHQHSIQGIVWIKGLSKNELRLWMDVLADSRELKSADDDDLYSRVKEAGIRGIELMVPPLWDHLFEGDSSLSGRFSKFKEFVLTKDLPPKPSIPRRLRNDDLKVLEEFRTQINISPIQDPDGMGLLQPFRIQLNQDEFNLKKLLGLGLKFLDAGGSIEQKQMGREILVKSSLLALERGWLPLFQTVLDQLGQGIVQKRDLAGEYQKTLDSIFHLDSLSTFLSGIQNEKMRDELAVMMKDIPVSSIRLMLLLLGEHESLPEKWESAIVKFGGPHWRWFGQYMGRDINHRSWNPLLKILVKKAPFCLPKIFEVLSSPSSKLEFLKRWLELGSPEALSFVRNFAFSENEVERKEAFSLLRLSRSKTCLELIQELMNGEIFERGSLTEKMLIIETFLVVTGVSGKDYLLAFWIKGSGGLIQRKADQERRTAMVRAVSAMQPEWLKDLDAAIPNSNVGHDIRALIQVEKNRSAKS